jgi:predicted amidohydrolase
VAFGFLSECETDWMRAALGVFRAGPDRRINLARMTGLCERAAGHGADLVMFCEASVTGFAGVGDPAHDLALGEPVPGPATAALASVARRLDLWVGFGLFERADGVLYDSAVLLDRRGQLRQTYRRIDPHWHRADANPHVYRQGTRPVAVPAEFAALGVLICGDLFSDEVLGELAALQPDVVLVPMARGFDADVADDAQWHDQEQAIYAGQLRKIGAASLIVNQLGGPPGATDCFGGALAVAADGTMLATWPPHTEGLLVVDVPPAGVS